MNDKTPGQLGIYGKYKVTKADGSPTDPEAEYFVLRVDKDPHASKALRTYAISVASENPALGEDLWNLCKRYGKTNEAA